MNKQINKLDNSIKALSKTLRPKNKKRKPRVPKNRGGSSLSRCSLEYLRSRENPFLESTACIPTEFNTPSMKVVYRVRGTFVTGTTGVGGVVVSPFNLVRNSNSYTEPTDARAAVISTDAAYAQTRLPIYSDNGIQRLGSNTPYNNVTLSSRLISARLVGSGLRVRNITPMMYRGGTLVGLESPGHENVTGLTLATMLNRPTASYGSIDGDWSSVVYHPIDADELDYSNHMYANNTESWELDHATQNYILGFQAVAATGENVVPQTYQFEVVSSFEITGPQTYGSTPSPGDPVGLGIIQSATSSAKSRMPKNGDRSVWLDHLLNYVTQPRILNTVTGLAINAYTNNNRRVQSSRVNQLMIEEID